MTSRNRTIYTVVTKPIRASEIVLGRTLGFSAVGTAMLVAMGIISYFFVTWSLGHDHEIKEADVSEETGKNGAVVRHYGETSMDQHHNHTFEVDENGKGRTNTVRGHWHEVTRSSDGKYRVGPAQGHLIARAPIYGKLVIFDRDGKQSKGINVGNEWEYRGYIEGGTPGVQTKAHAIWTFSNITPEKYPNGLPLELNLRVFRTFKGDIERGRAGRIGDSQSEQRRPSEAERADRVRIEGVCRRSTNHSAGTEQRNRRRGGGRQSRSLS